MHNARTIPAHDDDRGQDELLVALHDVYFSYSTPAGPRQVLRGLDLQVKAGETVAILGPSAAGKSTLLGMLACRLIADAGTVRLLGHDPARLDAQERAVLRQAIGMVDQASPLIGSLSVLDNVLISLGAQPRDAVARARAQDLLGRLGLAHRAQQHPGDLSGGERQRVAIVRALLGTPALLLADEPTGSQDTATARIIDDLLLDYAADGVHAVVIVTHDLALASRAAHAYRLDDGRLAPVVVDAGTPRDREQLPTYRILEMPVVTPAVTGPVEEHRPKDAAEAQDTPGQDKVRMGWSQRGAPVRRHVLAGLVIAALVAAGGGAAYTYTSAQQDKADAQRAAQALAAELQADRRTVAWPQFLHDPAHSGTEPAPGPDLQGRVAWQKPLGGPVISSPVVDRGTVFIGGTDGYLHVLDARTGRERWRFTLGGDLVNTSPAVHGGLVYSGASGNSLFALDERTGRPRWSAALQAPLTAPPVVAGGLVLAPTGAYSLQALDAGSGRLRWLAHPPILRDFAFPTLGAPTVSGDTVYVPFGVANSCVALRLSDGKLLWQVGPVGDRLTGSPAVDATSVYFETWNGTLIAIDRATHALRWDVTIPGTRNQGAESAPVRAGDLLLVPDYDGRLYALDSRTGHIRWSTTTTGELLASPVVAGTLAYQPSSDGRLYAIDLHSGRISWTLAIGESRSTPALADGYLYVGSLGRRALLAVR